MNASGPPLALAFRNWLASLPADADAGAGRGVEGRLVILHDELEAPLGRLKVRMGPASARGHRGVRSCLEALRGVGGGEEGRRVVRVGVGVGRCEGRGKEEVVGWLLREMEGWEARVLRGRAAELEGVLRGIAEGEVRG